MLKVVIIDDELCGREMLQALLKKFFSDRVMVYTPCCSIAEGLQAVNQYNPDLVFLDIEMPGGSGFDFLKTLGTINFELVFVTGHSGYAIEAFKVHALDYLLKPVNPVELTKTIEWIEQRVNEKRPSYDSGQLIAKIKKTVEQGKIGVPTNQGVVFLDILSIIRCEASSNYSFIYSEPDKKILVSRTLKELADALTDHDFVRVHKSHLINLRKLSYYHRSDGIIQLQDGSKIPLGRNCKHEFEKSIQVI